MDSWKEAASLIIVVENNSSQSSLSSSLLQSFNLLMTKRSDKASFLGSAFVFPGGHLEISDFSPEWWKVFNQAGFSESHVNSVVKRINGPRTPIINECQTKLAAQQHFSSSPSLKDNVLPSDIGLRICAIRETFEETGVLLAHNSSNSMQIDAISIENWRSKVRDNASDFIQFCLEMKIAPNIWDLCEWSNWLTPNALGHRRFDTMFYIYCTSNKPETDSDQKEVAMIEWYTPNELLDLQKQKKAFLAPPQVYELSRLSNFKEFHELKNFVFKRESDGVERWIPLVKGYADGSVFFLPGDDSYGLDNKTSIRSMPTLEQARSLVSHLNRIEFKEKVLRAFCNIKLNCGHISPLTFPSTILQSSL